MKSVTSRAYQPIPLPFGKLPTLRCDFHGNSLICEEREDSCATFHIASDVSNVFNRRLNATFRYNQMITPEPLADRTLNADVMCRNPYQGFKWNPNG
jgi:hypothetical protein